MKMSIQPFLWKKMQIVSISNSCLENMSEQRSESTKPYFDYTYK